MSLTVVCSLSLHDHQLVSCCNDSILEILYKIISSWAHGGPRDPNGRSGLPPMTKEEQGNSQIGVVLVVVGKPVGRYAFFPIILSKIDKTCKILQECLVPVFHIWIRIRMEGGSQCHLRS